MAADEVRQIRTNADWLRSTNEYELICGIADRLEDAYGKSYACPLEIIFGQANHEDCLIYYDNCKECLRKWLYKERK